MGAALDDPGVRPRLIVVGGVRTQLHAAHAVAWIRSTSTRQPDEVMALHGDGITRLVMQQYDPSVSFVAGGEPDVYLSVGVPSAAGLAKLTTSGFRGPIICVDEGLGSYGGLRSHYAAIRREGSGALGAGIRSTVRRLASLSGRRWPSFVSERDGWSVNDAVANELLRRAPSPDPGDGHAILLLQPWVGLGLQTATERDKVIEAIARMTSQHSIPLLVRPHPLEPDISIRSDVDIVEPVGLAEHDPIVLGARAVIGETSTSLLNLAAFFGKGVIGLTTPATPRVSRRQASLLQHFTSTPIPVDELSHVDALSPILRGSSSPG